MCITHKPDLLKRWRIENRGRDVITAYKIVCKDNRSWHSDSFMWSVGKHSVIVQNLFNNYFNVPVSGRGFYAYKDKKDAFHWLDGSLNYKIIAVYIKPKDVAYLGYQQGFTSYQIFVCRALEIKSLRKLRQRACDVLDREEPEDSEVVEVLKK